MKYSLNKQDATKILKGALIAGSGAVLAYALQILPTIDFGAYTGIAAAALSILINAGLKFLEGQTETHEQ